MAKQITQTVGKYSESHDRMTLTFKFPNGENLRINGSRYRTSLSVKAPAGGKSYGPGALQIINNVAHNIIDGENNGQRFKRILAAVEKTMNIAEAAVALQASKFLPA